MVIMILILVGDWFIREYVKDWEKKFMLIYIYCGNMIEMFLIYINDIWVFVLRF